MWEMLMISVSFDPARGYVPAGDGELPLAGFHIGAAHKHISV